MASEVSICNAALRYIGAATITALSDNNERARACNDRYPDARDELLRMHQWNFALTDAKLARLSAAPVLEFDYAFQLPTDYLRVVAVFDNDDAIGGIIGVHGSGGPHYQTGGLPYRISGRTILANSEELWLRYIRQETDPTTMTPDFREVLARLLAAKIVGDIAQSTAAMERMEQLFRDEVARAKSADAIEDYPEQMPLGSWVTSRGL